jgi:dyslexia susceptibility 1 candidate gene 1 protein
MQRAQPLVRPPRAAANARLTCLAFSTPKRDATDRRIALDRERRDAVDARRRQELADERRGLHQWRSALNGGAAGAPPAAAAGSRGGDGVGAGECDGDESDYEEGDEGPEAADGAQPGGASGAAQAGDPAGLAPAPDHPDYYGRGWRPGAGKQQKDSGDALLGGGGRGGEADSSSSQGDDSEGGAALTANRAGGAEGSECKSGGWEAARDVDCWGAGGDDRAGEEPAPVPAPRRGALAPVKVWPTSLWGLVDNRKR